MLRRQGSLTIGWSVEFKFMSRKSCEESSYIDRDRDEGRVNFEGAS
jgi:hypothetical protein